jgi:hypothetical protein
MGKTKQMQSLATGLKIYTTEFTQPWDEFAHLMVLDLTGCQLTNPDLMRLEKLVELRVLNLSATNIADDTITYLFQLSSLTLLYLQNTKVSPKALARLRKQLPGCGIIA